MSIPITVRAMSRYLAYRNAPRLAAYLAPPVDDVVTRLRPALRAASVNPGRAASAGSSQVDASRTPRQRRAPVVAR